MKEKKKVFIKNYHHIVSPSPWPFLMSIAVSNIAMGIVVYLHKNVPHILLAGMGMVVMIFTLWMRDIVREATFQGAWTRRHCLIMRTGFQLFIASEAMFFFSFFWAYFYGGVSPSIHNGVEWPPSGIFYIKPWGIPFYNTVILVTSGVFATCSHHMLKAGRLEQALKHLHIACLLGGWFTLIQGYEFYTSPFTIACSIYGSSFFLLTGFHGIHVIVGTIFLYVQYQRMRYNHFTRIKHLGLKLAIWYWHFVDLIWLVVYVCVYWWSWWCFGKEAEAIPNPFTFIFGKK